VPSSDEHGDPKKPLAHSLLERAWPAAEEHFLAATEPMRVNETTRTPVPVTLKRLASDIQLPPLPDAVRWTAPTEGREEEEQPKFDWAKETVRHVGIVVHRWFQRIAQDEVRGWDAKRVDSLHSRFVRELQRRGVLPSEMNRATGLVTTALKNALSDERGRWLLGPHPIARAEYQIRTRTRSYRIDRYFQDNQGRQWVVDYKTSEHEGSDVETFLDEQRARYAPQLDAYSAAMNGARRGLYFPLMKGWREISGA